jgi:hypothetical protein
MDPALGESGLSALDDVRIGGRRLILVRPPPLADMSRRGAVRSSRALAVTRVGVVGPKRARTRTGQVNPATCTACSQSVAVFFASASSTLLWTSVREIRISTPSYFSADRRVLPKAPIGRNP